MLMMQAAAAEARSRSAVDNATDIAQAPSQAADAELMWQADRLQRQVEHNCTIRTAHLMSAGTSSSRIGET